MAVARIGSAEASRIDFSGGRCDDCFGGGWWQGLVLPKHQGLFWWESGAKIALMGGGVNNWFGQSIEDCLGRDRVGDYFNVSIKESHRFWSKVDFFSGEGGLFRGTSGGGLALSAAVGIGFFWGEADSALAEIKPASSGK